MLLVDRPVRDGAKQIPDERYVYYRSATEGDLQCAVTLIAEKQLMQPLEYLPETGTILSITDMAGVLRTGGEEMALPTPAGCWLYGDLAVLICDEVGCGVTPLDRGDREWREQVGRACCRLAAEAEAVYRVHCGVGVRIK